MPMTKIIVMITIFKEFDKDDALTTMMVMAI